MARKPEGAGGGVDKVMEMLREHSVEYVDLRFTDPRGKWQHTAQHVSTIDEEAFRDGIMFDGSSIAGWKAINESDMILMPDPETAVMDPFAAKPTPDPDLRHRRALDRPVLQPRPARDREEGRAYLKSTGIGDTVLSAPRPSSSSSTASSSAPGQLRHVPARQPGRPAGLDEGLPRGQHGPPPQRSRAATSRCRRSIAKAICAPRCSRPWPRWGS